MLLPQLFGFVILQLNKPTAGETRDCIFLFLKQGTEVNSS